MKKTVCLILSFLCIAPNLFAEGPPPAKVVVTGAEKSMSSKTSPMIGVLDFDRESDVSSEVSGLVESVHFNVGDRVKRGDVLVRLNTDLIRKDLEMEKVRIEGIEVRLKKTDKNLKRYEALFRNEAASEIDYDDLSFSYMELEKERDARIKSLEKIKLQITKSVIKAPFDGIIMEKNVESGGWVSPGNGLCRIASTKDLVVRLPVGENLLKFVTPGKELEMTVNAFDEKISGVVGSIVPVADERTKNITVKIIVPAMKSAIENLTVTVMVPVAEPGSVMVIPRDGLVSFEGADFVYEVKEGKASLLPVTVISYSGDMVNVRSPHMTAETRIIVEGNERLRPDQPVTVTGER